MYELYYSQGACSLAIHAALIELNVPFKLHDVSGDKKKAPEYLAVNPHGMVPALLDDGVRIREGAAILLHLLEKHDNTLLPKSGVERAAALEWLMYANSTLHPAMGRIFHLLGSAMDAQVKEGALAHALKYAQTKWQEIERHLGESRYLAGEKLTIGDILMAVIANWTVRLNSTTAANALKFSLGANTKRVLKEVAGRPSFQKALAAEQVEYKAAA